MTPQERWIVLIEIITIKVIEFQNFSEQAANFSFDINGCGKRPWTIDRNRFFHF
jgi:hypothetical protein